MAKGISEKQRFCIVLVLAIFLIFLIVYDVVNIETFKRNVRSLCLENNIRTCYCYAENLSGVEDELYKGD